MSSPSGGSPGSPAPPPATALRRAFWRRHRGLLVGLVIVGIFTLTQTMNGIEETNAREPLRSAAHAATVNGDTIGVVDPGTAGRWRTGGGPTEEALTRLSTTGSKHLEGVYLALGPEPAPPPNQRCYYLAVQPGSTFDPAAADSLVQVCYRDPDPTPYRLAQRSVYR